MNKKQLSLIAGTAIAITGTLLFFNSCATIPKGVTAITPFDAERYLGKWYEIARIDFKFEKNLNNTTAEYSLNDDGSIKVVNRGYNYVKNEWKEAEGKAKFVESPRIAMLKVSFFGPFYAGYNVIALDADYKYALVIGKKTKYCWILSREKSIPDEVRKEYVQKASDLGVNTEELIWVKHNE